jgi:hypothetical protein
MRGPIGLFALALLGACNGAPKEPATAFARLSSYPVRWRAHRSDPRLYGLPRHGSGGSGLERRCLWPFMDGESDRRSRALQRR